MKKKLTKFFISSVPVLLFLVVTVLEYVSIEFFLGSSIPEIGIEYGLKNICLALSVNLALVALIHRLKPSLFISEGFFVCLGAANFFVDKFRGYGIVSMDLYSVKTAGEVAGGYDYTPDVNFFAGLVAILLCFVLTAVYRGSHHKYFSLKYSVGSCAAAGAIAAFYIVINMTPWFFNDVSSLCWDHKIGMNQYGYMLYFLSNAGSSKVEEPPGYSPEKVDKILEKYSEEKKTDSVSKDNSGDNPNIIMIMNESYSDLSVLGDIKTDKPYFSNYRRLKKHSVYGYAQSSVYGGYTSISEFEFLSGMSKEYIPGNPYLQYVKNYLPNLITTIKANDRYSEAIAVHPYNGSGYNRNRVYPLLGFDKFYDISSFKGAPLLRNKYVSDEADYEMLEKLYEKKKKGSRLCLFNVTMQNHNPYTLKCSFSDPVDIQNFTGQKEAEQYLSCIRQSDLALGRLTNYFKKQKEHTIILIFGDHQPHLPDAFYARVMGKYPDDFTQEDTMKTHRIPFMIWANYDIGTQDVGITSINYLSALLLQKAGLRMTDFDRYRMDLMKEVPSASVPGYYDKTGKLYQWVSVDDKNEKRLKEYRYIIYNYLFDEKNRSDRHFKVNSD